MTRFPTAAHLVSWAGLAPVARQSGPRQRKPSKGQGDVYLKTYCAQAANGTGNTDTLLGARLRRLTRRLGATKAMCAVGRSILVIIWHLLADPAARFTDLGPGSHDEQASRDQGRSTDLPGQRVRATLVLDSKDAITVPRQAVFERDGTSIVYRRGALGFEPVIVKLGAASPGRVAITSGLAQGDGIAERDPTQTDTGSGSAQGAP